jgi:hypothetical protein
MNITEKRFRELFENKTNNSIYKYFDDEFKISYHIVKENVKYNIYFKKISYLNSTEKVSIAKYDFNTKKLKNILETADFNIFKDKLNEILLF